MAGFVNNPVQPGDAIVDIEEKVLPDYEAEPGEKAYVLMHTIPFEGSVGLVNMLTVTRLARKGFDVSFVLFGPGSLMASATRGYPRVGDEAFPGNMNYNNQIKTILEEGSKVYACRFSAAALYGMRESDFIEGVKGVHPRDILDFNIQAKREGALTLATWNF